MSEARCFTSAASLMKAPPGFQTSAAFRDKRWTLHGDQRDERMRLFCRKLLLRLDGMGMPFYPSVGLMDLPRARQRYVTGVDPWTPAESPFLEGSAIEFMHVFCDVLPPRCWILFAEVGFDVAKLAQIPVMWGGFADVNRPGMWHVYDGIEPAGWRVDDRTYTVRKRGRLDYKFE